MFTLILEYSSYITLIFGGYIIADDLKFYYLINLYLLTLFMSLFLFVLFSFISNVH